MSTLGCGEATWNQPGGLGSAVFRTGNYALRERRADAMNGFASHEAPREGDVFGRGPRFMGVPWERARSAEGAASAGWRP